MNFLALFLRKIVTDSTLLNTKKRASILYSGVPLNYTTSNRVGATTDQAFRSFDQLP